MKILVTGSAGFIGFNLCIKLLEESDCEIIGIDNINDYYDVNLKYARLKKCGISLNAKEWHLPVVSSKSSRYTFIRMDIRDKININCLFQDEKFDLVCHLAAQAGVRHSLSNPDLYLQSNIIGFGNIIESCKLNNVKHILYASSSSVYGDNDYLSSEMHPKSLYAATKLTNELMAHVYSYLYGIRTIGLRFFSVYGPWGRPDMALFLFTKAIKEDKQICVFNNGNLYRDFTFIDDIVESIHLLIKKTVNHKIDGNNFKIFDIGNSLPILLNDFICIIEETLGKKAIKKNIPLQKGDVIKTKANNTKLKDYINYSPNKDIKYGVKEFIKWYESFY